MIGCAHYAVNPQQDSFLWVGKKKNLQRPWMVVQYFFFRYSKVSIDQKQIDKKEQQKSDLVHMILDLTSPGALKFKRLENQII
jgi:hypothetical protein